MVSAKNAVKSKRMMWSSRFDPAAEAGGLDDAGYDIEDPRLSLNCRSWCIASST